MRRARISNEWPTRRCETGRRPRTDAAGTGVNDAQPIRPAVAAPARAAAARTELNRPEVTESLLPYSR
jgi:hypothetical protein